MAAFATPQQILAYTQQLCAEYDHRIKAQVGSSADARLFAKQLVADLSIRNAEPLGVALMKQIAKDPSAFEEAPATLATGAAGSNRTSGSGGAGVDVRAGALHSTAALGSAAAPESKEQAVLRRAGPPSLLKSCPYCTEPQRRFCPESGRRHETADEKATRLWRTIYKQIQFSSKMANIARLERPNTCQEEFYIEL